MLRLTLSAICCDTLRLSVPSWHNRTAREEEEDRLLSLSLSFSPSWLINQSVLHTLNCHTVIRIRNNPLKLITGFPLSLSLSFLGAVRLFTSALFSPSDLFISFPSRNAINGRKTFPLGVVARWKTQVICLFREAEFTTTTTSYNFSLREEGTVGRHGLYGRFGIEWPRPSSSSSSYLLWHTRCRTGNWALLHAI